MRSSTLVTLDSLDATLGIPGAITSIAPAPSFLASGAEDRFLRLHSTFPPASMGEQQEEKGQVLEKAYMKVMPTVVLWDGRSESAVPDSEDHIGEENDMIWEEMQTAESDEEQAGNKTRAK